MPRTPPAPQAFERRVPGIRYGVLDELVGYAVRRAQIAVYLDLDRELGPRAMTPQRFSAMVVIGENAGISQRDLGLVLGIARSGVVQIVDGLASRGWVVREADAADARTRRLHLTAAGTVCLADVRRRVRAHDRRIARRLTDTQRGTLIRLLGLLGPED